MLPNLAPYWRPQAGSSLSNGRMTCRNPPVDWENPQHRLARKEPRLGRRFTLAAKVQCPSGPLVVYSCHLEVMALSMHPCSACSFLP